MAPVVPVQGCKAPAPFTVTSHSVHVGGSGELGNAW